MVISKVMSSSGDEGFRRYATWGGMGSLSARLRKKVGWKRLKGKERLY